MYEKKKQFNTAPSFKPKLKIHRFLSSISKIFRKKVFTFFKSTHVTKVSIGFEQFMVIFRPEPVLGLKLADLDAQFNFLCNIHNLKAEMSIALVKLPLPRWFPKKCFKFHCRDCIEPEIFVLDHQIHSVSEFFTCKH